MVGFSPLDVTVDATPNGAGVALPAGSISVGPAGTDIPIFATAVSNAWHDTAIKVHSGGGTTTFSLTSVRDPQVWFHGRFEARFATDGDYYKNPRGSDGPGTASGGSPGFSNIVDGQPAGPGWPAVGLEGEPDFVPAGPVANSFPNPIDKPVGRVVRYNNHVALRPFAAWVGNAVNEIHRSSLANWAGSLHRQRFRLGRDGKPRTQHLSRRERPCKAGRSPYGQNPKLLAAE
jgi:hypothetical protein